jgi:DNA-binding beta-propeller fold protein YncE
MQPTQSTLPALLAALLLVPAVAPAQQNGYVNGSLGLFSFNPTTGAIVTSTTTGGTAQPFAVASDDATLYLPSLFLFPDVMSKVEGATGETLGSVPLGVTAIALTQNGATAFAMTGGGQGGAVSVIDTASLTITNTVDVGCPADIALSPDGATLYVSVANKQCPPQACPEVIGVCAFNASTWALEWSVPNVFGLLSVSYDGSMLYVAGSLVNYPINVINTATHAVTNLEVKGENGWPAVRVATSPVSSYAVVVEEGAENEQGVTLPASAYLLNTATNKFVGTVFTSAPGGTVVPNKAGGAAIAPDGRSVWMLLACGPAAPVEGCVSDNNQLFLAGFSLPSMQQIAFEPLQGQFISTSEIEQSIAFPQLTTK